MHKILVANRGEIALRVMRTARAMGIGTVAVYSEADRHAPHVKYADEAVLLGPAPSSESYLVMDKIINLAKSKNVDAIHPGYGFLSENSNFARQCAKNGIIFIGPNPEVMDALGDKITAKKNAEKCNVPIIEGNKKTKKAKVIAKEIGFPILIKASAGGGGKGMRVVESEDVLEEQMNRAIRC